MPDQDEVRPQTEVVVPIKRHWARVGFAVGALVALGFAGLRLYRIASGGLDDNTPATFGPPISAEAAKAQEKNATEIAEVHSRLVILGDREKGDAKLVVALGRPTHETSDGALRKADMGIAARELVRQALLIAARDELGIGTRDESIGDAFDAGPEDKAVDVASVFREEGVNRCVVRRPGTANTAVEPLLDLALPNPMGDLGTLVEAAEVLSRKPFPETLKALGLTGSPNVFKPDAEKPDEWDSRVGRLGQADAFGMVREAHDQIRKNGESSARLGALVRGYALLGTLNEFQWHPAHKAFKARALLYAQRLFVRTPNVPWALWHRAFARALAGLHQDAIDDLATAKSKAMPGDPSQPGWVEMIDAFARSDSARLALIKGAQANLAALLLMMVVEYPSTVPTLNAASRVVARDADCFRAVDVMCRYGGVANLHTATLLGPSALDSVVPEKLKVLPTIPDSVKAVISDQKGGVALVGALEREGAVGRDAGEPSWNVMGRMLAETRFIQVYWRLYFMRAMWGVSAVPFWDENHLSVSTHRYRPFLETYAVATDESNAEFAAFAKDLDLTDLEISALDMIYAVRKVNPSQGTKAWNLVIAHRDTVTRDYARLACFAGDEDKPRFARMLLGLSPANPFGKAIQIEYDWEKAEPQLTAWQKNGDQTAVVAALARQYTKLGKADEAIAILEREVKKSTDPDTYTLLAANYKKRGDLARWKSTLDDYLANVPDHGLDHAKISVEIAEHFMKLREWDKAEPYADAAAGTWAAWAMMCASKCHEGMGDWEQAELWMRRVTERYTDTEWGRWFYWCKSADRGDIDSARAFAESYLQAAGPNASRSPCPLSNFYTVIGDLPRALKVLAMGPRSTDPMDWMDEMLLRDSLGDSAGRDALLKEYIETNANTSPKTNKILGLLRNTLDHDTKGALDEGAIEAIFQTIPVENRSHTEYIVASLLKNHGYPDLAKKYFGRCVDKQSSADWHRGVARDLLRALGGNVTR